MANVNDIGFLAFPKELIVGVLLPESTPDAIASVLTQAGVAPDAIHFLQGDEGLRILNPEGDAGSLRENVVRKIEHVMHEGDVLAILAENLRADRTLLGVHHVAPDDAARLTELCADNGVEQIHYLGRWTMH
jgi:hypothetical protein